MEIYYILDKRRGKTCLRSTRNMKNNVERDPMQLIVVTDNYLFLQAQLNSQKSHASYNNPAFNSFSTEIQEFHEQTT